jgi:lipopolysaccharide transport system ATP-binding protein
MPSIILEKVSVDFPVYDGAQRSFRRKLMQLGIGGVISQRGRGHLNVRALDGIDLALKDGDRIGLIGHNGAGKSTLLRILAGIREPTSGSIVIDGKTAALLSLGSILDPEMTGYENIERASVLLEIPGKRRKDLVLEVEQFTGLGDYLNLPVKVYSAGMQLRLSYALMTAQEPDILLLDEIYSAGDAEFRAKSEERICELGKRTSILVFSSHAPNEIERICNKVVWLEHGRIRRIGAIADTLEEFQADRKMNGAPVGG